MMKFYAVARGWKTGVYKTWDACKKEVFQFPNARFKKFESKEEAEKFIEIEGKVPKATTSSATTKSQLKKLKQEEAKKFIEEGGGKLINSTKPNVSKSQFKKLKNKKLVVSTSIEITETINEFGLLVKNGIPVVYTDGACSKNGKNNSKAGIGVYWGNNHKWNVSSPIIGHATNNRAEYFAIINAMEKGITEGLKNLIVRTDCRLIISSMELWIHRWEKNGWKTKDGKDVLNKDLLVQIQNLQKQIKVYFEKVAGHSGDYNNEQADKLAREGAQLYTG